MDSLYFDKDVSLDSIKNLKIIVLGYGNQGKAHALNLRDSGLNVTVGLRDNSASLKTASEDGFDCIDISKGVSESDIISILIPDQCMAEVFDQDIVRYLKPGKMLIFAHGYNIHYKEIVPPPFVDVGMVAPSGPGYAVRKEFQNGNGVPTLFAINQDITGRAKQIVLAYSKAIGGTRTCCFQSSFEEETETDLFGEQISLTGIIPMIINESFKVLLEAGYSPVVSWFVSFYEVKNIADLISKIGINDFYKAVSETAEYGGLRQADKLIDDKFKNEMKSALDFIKSGKFHQKWKNETSSDYPELKAMRGKLEDSPINEITNKMLKILDQNKSNED
tara:strand:+ start:1039 stop:2040 length:1002 start_codon:yes stop_codon:yes gene_type:complete